MDTLRRLLAAGLIAMLSLFAVACGDGGDDDAIEQEDDGGDDDNGDDD